MKIYEKKHTNPVALFKHLKSLKERGAIIEREQNVLKYYFPILWYHGTTKDFKKFSFKYFGKTDAGWWGYGIYFHTEKDRGAYGNIIKVVELNFNNVINFPTNNAGKYLYKSIGIKAGLKESYMSESPMNIIKAIGKVEFRDICLKNGFDGMIIEYAGGTKEAVVFDAKIIAIKDTIQV